MRETAAPAPERQLSDFHLARYRITQEEFTQRSELQARAQAAQPPRVGSSGRRGAKLRQRGRVRRADSASRAVVLRGA